jgi:hypothetical protein
MKKNISFILLVLFIVSGNITVFAGDLDDGISKFTDGSISSEDDMGKADKNIKFIIMNSKSRAKVAEKSGGAGKTRTGKTTGDHNQNSVVMGAGSKIMGDVIIVAPEDQ